MAVLKSTPRLYAKAREELRKDLLDQLDRNNTHGKHYTDLVDDYMCFWDMKNGLHQDVIERGEKVENFDSRGKLKISNNESIEQAVKVNGQMLKILNELGIKPSQGGGEDEDDDL